MYSGRSRRSKVVYVGSGAGPWNTTDGIRYGDPSAAAIARGQCTPYANFGGERDYSDDEAFDFTQCERHVGRNRWYYVTFNAGDSGEVLPAVAGFSLSSRQVP